MSEQANAELKELRADNARLRHLLAQEGAGAELRHQVRNTLAQIRSIVRRAGEINEMAADFAAHLEGRLDAILWIQNAIIGDPDQGVDLYLLIANELLVCLAREGEQTLIEGPDLRLRPKAAEGLALAFHELATNAVKFGALSEPKGFIEVRWQVDDATGLTPRFVLTWKETGGPPIEDFPIKRGFGTEVLERMLDYQLKAKTTLTFEPDGLRCSIDMPFSASVGSLSPTLALEGNQAREG